MLLLFNYVWYVHVSVSAGEHIQQHTCEGQKTTQSLVLVPHQGSFSLQQMETITEIITDENAELWSPVPTDASYPGLEDHGGREVEQDCTSQRNRRPAVRCLLEISEELHP